MTTMTQSELTDRICDTVGAAELAHYLCAPSGHVFGLYAAGDPEDGYSVGQDVGMEIDPDERPFATVRCPGVGHADLTWYAGGYAHRTDAGWIRDEDGVPVDAEDIIRAACEDGDVSEEVNELRERLLADAIGQQE